MCPSDGIRPIRVQKYINIGLYTIEMTASTLLIFAYLIIAFIVAWLIASVPVYIAARMVSGKRATFGRALIASLRGPIVVVVFLLLVSSLLFPFLFLFAYLIGIIASILALSYLFGSIFSTGMVGGFGIAILSFIVTIVVFAVLSFIITLVAGVTVTLPAPLFRR